MRVGTGYDVHQFSGGRPLTLGGVSIPYPLGLMGYSDADVVLHAIADALLGACALGDIGQHFPTGDPRYRNANSGDLLRTVVKLVRDERGLGVGNVDVTIVAQRPKLLPYIPTIRQSIATLLEVDLDAVSVKATTTDHLGFEGRGEGMAALCVVLLQ